MSAMSYRGQAIESIKKEISELELKLTDINLHVKDLKSKLANAEGLAGVYETQLHNCRRALELLGNASFAAESNQSPDRDER